MKLLHAANITVTKKRDSAELRRGDIFNLLTGEYPPDVGDGDPDEIISRVTYNEMETMELEDAATDMNDLDVLVYRGKRYHIIEARRSRPYGFWDFIKCTRQLF
jgi:hypothetical protein